jgi:hypothetical protein
MKQLLVLAGVLLLALTACTQSEGGIPSPTGVKENVPSTVTGTNLDEEAAMLEQVKTETIAKNDKTLELVIPVNNKRGSVGDTVAFGVNFNQVNKQAATYLARVSFIEARDKNSNKIEVDKDTIHSWLAETETLDFALGDGESYYLPIVVRIKNEIKPGVKTVPGAYQYEIQFFRRGKYDLDEKLDKLVRSVYVRVE